jgi:hypothetical protein
LTNLPFGTSSRDLHDITLATKAKSCYIPRSNNYKPRPFAIFYFQSEEDLNDAIKTPYALDNHELQWCSAEAKCCHKCGSTEHLVMKCSLIEQQNKDEDSSNRKPRNQLPSVQKLYNRFKPAGSRSLIVKTPNQRHNDRSYSNVTKGKNKDPNPKVSSVKDSVHNPSKNDDTNAKLDKILNMLTGMQKAMSDLETRIAKLETFQLSLTSSDTPIPTPIISAPPITPHNTSSSGSNKRTQIASSSSDENTTSTPKSIDPKIQAFMDEQRDVIAEQQSRMQVMMAQLIALAPQASQ